MAKMTKKNRHILLRGEGIHQHVLHGDFMVENEERDFSEIVVNKDGLLQHEKPDGSFGEHHTLPIPKDDYVMGRQVEYNPFDRTVTRVWD